jgi:hypothetical protein
MSFSDRFVRVARTRDPRGGSRTPRANGGARSLRRSAAEPGQNGREPGWLPIRTYYAWHVPKVRIVYTFARPRQSWLLLKLVPFVRRHRSIEHAIGRVGRSDRRENRQPSIRLQLPAESPTIV